VGRIDPAREAAIQRLARDLGVSFQKAERWCVAWERCATRHSVAFDQYFWDAARGWIDAQRAMRRTVGPVERPRSGGAAG
jgi:hypothetical protein